jgi:iron(III) transport system substrate-binding protein
MKGQGAPIEWVETSNPIVTGMRVVSIGVRPPHPNAAKLLFDFVISKEGQSLIRTFYRIPAHPDLDPLTPKLDPKKFKLFGLHHNWPSMLTGAFANFVRF